MSENVGESETERAMRGELDLWTARGVVEQERDSSGGSSLWPSLFWSCGCSRLFAVLARESAVLLLHLRRRRCTSPLHLHPSPNTNWGPTPAMYSRTSLRSSQNALRCLQCGQRRGLAGEEAPGELSQRITDPSPQLPPRAPSHTRPATPLAPSTRVETSPARPPRSPWCRRPALASRPSPAWPRASRSSLSGYDSSTPLRPAISSHRRALLWLSAGAQLELWSAN
jgi:hypothetical protein